MDFKDISLPEVYTDSEDFRFFCKWFAESLEQLKYDTDNKINYLIVNGVESEIGVSSDSAIMYNYPAYLKPLARRNDNDSKAVDCFQVVIMGAEICNAYSELVDPAIQRQTFEDQLAQKEAGDDETMDLDEDYLLAMEQGMPPISGLGFGIDRLMMLIYNQDSIRDVVLFPLMKPEE